MARRNTTATGLRTTALCVPLVLLALLLTPLSALALDNAKTAVTMVQLAAKAYEAGDFAKAAEQYAKAWHLDPQPTYLWALARAEHLATMLDAAAEHYRTFIALPGADPVKVTKATQYLADAETELVKSQIRAADTAMQGGKPAMAAELYLSALKTAPGRFDLLFKTGSAEQMAEQWQSALAHFEEYLARAPADAADRPQAIARQGWLRQKLGLTPQVITPPAVAKPTVTPAPNVALTTAATGPSAQPHSVTAPAEARTAWPEWTLIGGGAALLAVGVTLVIGGYSDATTVNAAQQHAAGELIGGLTYDQAAAQVSSANTRIGVGAALTGVGAAVAGVGIWWLLHTDSRHAFVLPSNNGAVLVGQF